MSFGSSFDTKLRVKEAIDIVDLVGEYIPLRRQGRGYQGICPWHDDTRPSLQVNPERQSFKCWVCDLGGDVFSFMMKVESVTFPEALSMLAEKAGISLAPSPRGGRDSDRDEKQSLYQTLAWAEGEYHHLFVNDPQAEPARRYVAERQIGAESVSQFHIGFAPDRWDWLIGRAASHKIVPARLERVGLVARRQEGNGYYDRFRGRLLFSIRDAQNRPVGFGGRLLPGIETTSQAKYINSPETPLFSKSNLLYGLDVAREPIRRSGTAIVVEGYTDCIMAHQHGVSNVVAVLGTALGPRHLNLLRRYADRIVLVLDGDEAGQRRAAEILELFVAAQVDLRVLSLPSQSDPCDLLLARGGDTFRDIVESAPDALDHKLQRATVGIDLVGDTHAANQALDEVLTIIARAPVLGAQTQNEAGVKKDQFLQRLSRKFGVAETQLRDRLRELRRRFHSRQVARSESSPPEEHQRQTQPLRAQERELLELLIKEPAALRRLREAIDVDELEHRLTKRVFLRCGELADNGHAIDFERLLVEFDEPEVKTLLVDLDEQSRGEGRGEFDLRMRNLIHYFEQKRTDQQRRTAAAALRRRRDDEDKQRELLDQIVRSQKDRQGISAPMEG